MAKIQTETVVLTFNRLVKDSESAPALLTPEITAALEQVAQELAGTGVVVEVQVA
jgi:ABC-type arginine transport system ATPase subunit